MMVVSKWIQALLVALCWLQIAVVSDANAVNDETCVLADDGETCASNDLYRDRNLKTMTFKLEGDEEESTFDAYVLPDISALYNETEGSRTKRKSKFQGLFGKFINLSPKKIRVMWQPNNPSSKPSYISDIAPFGAAGTATHPSHKFIVVDPNDRNPSVDSSLAIFQVEKGNSLYVYDPYGSIEEATKQLLPKFLKLYKLQSRSLAFNRIYEKFTGRQYVALYGKKHAPRRPMWAADFFGQTHVVTTKETHIIRTPPDEILPRTSSYGTTQEQRDSLSPYRESGELNLTLTALSIAPRVFEIKNFLSEEEAHHIKELASGIKLARSTTRAGSVGEGQTSDTTRTSFNSWVARQLSPIVDVIFRRAADLIQVDEALLRYRNKDEPVQTEGSNGPICERLQLVHYAPGQQYTPHHDFSVPDLKDNQASRFATILFYLNEGMEGGETSFPKWVSAETDQPLKVVPEIGKAILFYNQLPDGNYDDFSEHAALPIVTGEKWLTNLWVWDPHM